MEQSQDTVAGESTQSTPRSDELVRPLTGRMLAGVSQGLAARFGIPVWLIRVIFIVTAFAGGVGIALYAAGWALVRSEDESETPAERLFAGADSKGNWLGIALITVAALILLGNFSFFSGEVLLAVALLTIGVLMYTGHIPTSRPPSAEGDGTDDKEGVQQMTTTTTVVPETTTGDSPAGGSTPPPATPTPTRPNLPAAKLRERSILGRLTIGVMLVGVGLLAILDNIDSVPIDAEPRHYMALAVTILGVGLLVGSLAGRARWLIIVGAILVPTLMFSPAFEYDWTTDEFDLVARPVTFAELDTGYSIDVGRLEVDLTELPWDGRTVTLDADVDLGLLVIRIPAEVGIVGRADLNIGSVDAPGRTNAGLGDPHINFNQEGPQGTVVLDAHVDIGNIEIRR